MMEKKCSNCDFSAAVDISKLPVGQRPGIGQKMRVCRLFPPQVVAVIAQGHGGVPVQMLQCMYPPVSKETPVCGQYTNHDEELLPTL